MMELLSAWLLGGAFVGFTVWLIMQHLLKKRIFWWLYLSDLLEERYGAVTRVCFKCGDIEVDFSAAAPSLEVK